MKKSLFYIISLLLSLLPIWIFTRDYILETERKGHLELSMFAGIVFVTFLLYMFQRRVLSRKAQAKENLKAFGKKNQEWKLDIIRMIKLSFFLGMLVWFTSIVNRFSADMHKVLIYIWICEFMALIFLMLGHMEEDKTRQN